MTALRSRPGCSFVLSTRKAPRSSTVYLHALFAAALALALMLALTASASAAPVVTIDSGPAEGSATNNTTPVFTFTVDPSATTIECSIDQGFAFYISCSDTFSPVLPLAEGDYTFRVHASDGVEDTFVTRDFTVDVTRPSLSIDSGPGRATRNTTPSFGFTVDPSATDVECSLDQGSASFASCTSPYVSSALPDGDYTFRVQASDAAGNTSGDSLDFTLDTTPPSVTIDSGPTGATRDRTPTFGFTVVDASTTRAPECSIDDGTPSYGSCTTVSSDTASSLSDGDYVFHVRLTDALGNQTETSQSFSVDATAPDVQVVSGPSGATSNPLPVFGFTVDGTATRVECSIDQGATAYVSCSGPTYAPSAPLADGDYRFRVRASDALGNERTVRQDFTVDSEAPALTIDSGPSGPTSNAMPTFGFTTDATRVECSVDHGTPTYRSCPSSTSYTAALLAEGSYVFHLRATDEVGNQAEAFQRFTVDTTPPTLSISFGPSGTTGDSTPLFGFSAEVNTTLACSIDQGTPAYGPCTGPSSHAAVAPLADGAYVFRVQATDRAGNQTEATRTFTVATGSSAPGSGTDPTPTPTPTPTKPRLMSPFPLVRISGTLTSRGARIRLLSVRAPHGALVRVAVSPPCGRRRHARRCRVVRAAGTVGRGDLIGFRGLARSYRSGTVIVVRVWSADRIGKYTRFTIVRGKAPRRVDQCLLPGATRGSRCPSE